MKFETCIVDAFTDRFACGNPAGVVFLEGQNAQAGPELMQQLAFELGLSETAFVSETEEGFSIRWFSPRREMPLCGHATLAAAHLLFERRPGLASLHFHSAAGRIEVERREEGRLGMSFPLDRYRRTPAESIYRDFFALDTIGDCIVGELTGKVVLILEDGADLRAIRPDFAAMRQASGVFTRGIGISARAADFDFETRYFNPWAGVDEDPVTGSVHTLLGRYWSERLGKTSLRALQNSQRPGVLELEVADPKIVISGMARVALRGVFDA